MGYHAILSPSSAHRWMNCAGSVLYERFIGEKKYDSVYSLEGTAFHELMAVCVEQDMQPADFKGQSFTGVIGPEQKSHTVVFDTDMLHYAEECLDWIKTGYLTRSCAETLGAEVEVPIGHITGEVKPGGVFDSGDLSTLATGSVDLLLKHRVWEGDSSFWWRLVVIDYKYGAGERVSVQDNEQLKLYALGALKIHPQYAFREVECVIMQPRNGGCSSKVYPVGELQVWSHEAAKKAGETKAFPIKAVKLEDIPLRTPSEKACRWCSGKLSCETLEKKAFTENIRNFENIGAAQEVSPQEAVAVMDSEHLATVAECFPLYDMFKKAIIEEIEKRVLASQPVRGWKLATSSGGHRKWDNEEGVADTLALLGIDEKLSHVKKIQSPAQLEKILKKMPEVLAMVKEHIVKPEGRIVVVPEVSRLLLEGSSVGFEDIS